MMARRGGRPRKSRRERDRCVARRAQLPPFRGHMSVCDALLLSMPPVRFVAAMVAAEVLGMLGIAAFPTLLPEFSRAWGLSATDSGWISGLYYAGYVAAVPVLTAATDRIDPRRIYLAATALGG